MEKELLEDESYNHVAIIGISCRFPGAENHNQYWENLRDGVESIKRFSDQELSDAGVSTEDLADPNYVKANPQLADVDKIDAQFFSMTPHEAKHTDPQHRLMLECVYNALEDAGYSDTSQLEVGLFGGVGVDKYLLNNIGASPSDKPFNDPTVLFGNDKGYSVTKIAHKLNLKGPAICIDTACSTSLVAVHLACKSLISYETDCVVAGGAFVQLPHNQGYFFQQDSILSVDGHCRSFSKDATGTIFGSGVGIVVLKRLSDAIEDNDQIYAVIRGGAVNNDGSGKIGFTAPGGKGQADVILSAQLNAEVSPGDISYVEAHGTATALGDPIELQALTEAFAQNTDKTCYCAIGSVKSNLGHLEAAAGIAGLIKTALALKHKQLPPTLHFSAPNPEIDFDNSPFYVNTELREWHTQGGPRIAGVSSFGIGGTNAHVILEEAPERETRPKSSKPELFLLSAKSESALQSMVTNLHEYVQAKQSIDFADMAYTLQLGRRSYPHRLALVASDREALLSSLKRQMQSGKGVVASGKGYAYLFPGQGAQDVNMFAQMYATEAVFCDALLECEQAIAGELPVSLTALLYPQDSETELCRQRLTQTSYTQVALFAVEYALSQLMGSWGIKPNMMLGHSVGEYVAACLAGVFSLSDGLRLVLKRGQFMQQCRPGHMLAVKVGADEISALLKEANSQCSIAAQNSPVSSVVSGECEDIRSLSVWLTEKGVVNQVLETSHAFHSQMMEPILLPFKEYVSSIRLEAPTIAFVSNVSGTWITPEEATSPDYWVRHLRGTVQFSQGVNTLLDAKPSGIIEMGPSGGLSAFVQQHRHEHSAVVVSLGNSARQRTDDRQRLLAVLGGMWQAGHEFDWTRLHEGEERGRISLPTYPFERKRYWIEPSLENSGTESATEKLRKPVSEWFYHPAWKRAPQISYQPQVTANKHTLVLLDGGFDGSQIAQLISDQGLHPIEVQLGNFFEQISPTQFIVNQQQRSSFEALFTVLKQQEMLPGNILHFGALNETGVTNEFTSHLGFSTFYGVMYLLQAWNTVTQNADLNLRMLSSESMNVIGNERGKPEDAMLQPLCRVVSQEYGNIKCQHIDLSVESDHLSDVTIKLIIDELCGDIDDTSLAIRQGNRWRMEYEAISIGTKLLPFSFKQKGIYLITGGLGKLGMILAKGLAEDCHAKIALTTRSAFPEKSEWRRWKAEYGVDHKFTRKITELEALEEKGAEVLVIQADIEKPEEMELLFSRIENTWGQVNGVIHAAGIAGEQAFQLVENIERDICDQIFAPKVVATQNLAQATVLRNLDFCVLMSSLSVPLGGVGNVVYASANCYLDAFANLQRMAGRNWISINWDAWHSELAQKESEQLLSASANLSASKFEQVKSMTAYSIIGKEGVKAMSTALCMAAYSPVVISTGDLKKRIRAWRTRDDVLFEKPDIGIEYVSPETELEALIVEVFENVFGYQKLGINDDFFQLGGDSLMGVKIINKLQAHYKDVLHVTALFEAPTPAALAKYLSDNYQSILDPEARVNERAVEEKDVDIFKSVIAKSIPLSFPKVQRKNKRAVIILSPPRSGSTLLRVMLAGHPDLFSPPELNLLNHSTLQEHLEIAKDNSSLHEGLLRAVIQSSGGDLHAGQQVIQQLRENDNSIESVYRFLQDAHSDKILVDKTPNYAHSLKILQRSEEMFDEPLYLYLQRHPGGMIHSYEKARLDLLSSQVIRDELNYHPRQLAELVYLDCHRNIQTFLKSVPGSRQCAFKFEDLVTETEQTLQQICHFIGIPYHQSMLDVYNKGQEKMTDGIGPMSKMTGDPNFHKHSGINPKVIHQWREFLSEDSLSIQTLNLANTLGYDTISQNEDGSNIDGFQMLEDIDHMSEAELDKLLLSSS
uniref:Malonyl CoA-acyl carrier protein transacylase n=1 Tax=Rheinheimera sp. BAL341 TaxID=1708203 RepID=A0A486XLP6_9GAMM